MLGKYIVSDTCGLRSPSFVSSSVLYIGTGCRVQVFSLILDSSVSLSAGIQSAGDSVPVTLPVRILHSTEEYNLSPFYSKLACLCQSIEIKKKKKHTHTTSTYTSSMQELIMQGMQQKLEKFCFRCKKNTCYILQPPKYLMIVVNPFIYIYINNNFTKDMCSIPMDIAVVHGLHTFSLQATIDHHGPSMYSGHYTTSINCCKKIHCNDSKITEFEMIHTKKLLYCLCGNI